MPPVPLMGAVPPLPETPAPVPPEGAPDALVEPPVPPEDVPPVVPVFGLSLVVALEQAAIKVRPVVVMSRRNMFPLCPRGEGKISQTEG